MQQEGAEPHHRAGRYLDDDLSGRIDGSRVGEELRRVSGIATRRTGEVRPGQHAEGAVVGGRIVEEDDRSDDVGCVLLTGGVPVGIVLVPGELRTLNGQNRR